MEPKWLTRDMVLAIHDEAVAMFGGLAGIRENGLLDSALDRPKNLFANTESPGLFARAAALCFGLVKNHPFLDGNKRTGLLAAPAFLFLNGQAFEPNETDEVNLIVAVAAGEADEAALARWFETFSAPRSSDQPVRAG
jgi:death-on-curing protein